MTDGWDHDNIVGCTQRCVDTDLRRSKGVSCMNVGMCYGKEGRSPFWYAGLACPVLHSEIIKGLESDKHPLPNILRK